ncbi:MAG: multiubiquitin domain-containing protein [Solirubrobacterales bacterium]
MPKYEINIEGTLHEWDRDTITVAELRQLGGLPADQEMIEIDLKDNSERVLGESESIALKPGKGFAKKVGFKRG